MNQKACKSMTMTQFELSKITLRNLNKFKLSPSSKLVLLALIDRLPNIFPAQQTIADQLGLGLATVKRAIAELRNQGLIITSENQKTNTLNYRFTEKIFGNEKLIPDQCQNDTSHGIKLSYKEKKEEKKKKAFSKRKYHHDTQQTGMQYKPFKADKIKRDDKTPMNNKECALKFLSDLSDLKSNPIINMQIQRVKRKWNL